MSCLCEIMCQWKVLSFKWHVYQILCHQMFRLRNDMFVWNSVSMKCLVYVISCLWNLLSSNVKTKKYHVCVKWRVYEMFSHGICCHYSPPVSYWKYETKVIKMIIILILVWFFLPLILREGGGAIIFSTYFYYFYFMLFVLFYFKNKFFAPSNHYIPFPIFPLCVFIIIYFFDKCS